MKKIVVSIEPSSWSGERLFYASLDHGKVILGQDYTTRWSAKRGVRRFMATLGATNWRFEDEPESEPAVNGVNSWARWEATDEKGSVWEYENEPVKAEAVWLQATGRNDCVRRGEYCNDWRKTLRRVNT